MRLDDQLAIERHHAIKKYGSMVKGKKRSIRKSAKARNQSTA